MISKVLSEEFYRLGETPIMACVLKFTDDDYSIGWYVMSRRPYDEVASRYYAKQNAIRMRERHEQRLLEKNGAA